MGDKREKMLEEEKELNKRSTFGIVNRREARDHPLNDLSGKLIRRLTGKREPVNDGFGTSLGPGAKAAERDVSREEWDRGKSLSEMEGTVRKAMREAAQEEQREAGRGSGMKKGGKVKASSASKRADGIAQRGKTRGKFV